MTPHEISAIVIDVAVAMHRRLGPGLLESLYLYVMHHELRLAANGPDDCSTSGRSQGRMGFFGS